jgi:UDP-GlcNAc:undecaprenyl-phosphate GlcNAc-1-phosphate transferase
MAWLCALLTLIALIISLPATVGMRTLGRRMGALDGAGVEGQVKFESRRVPNTGGVAIYLAIALPLIGAMLGLWLLGDQLGEAVPPLREHVPGLRSVTPLVLTYLGCLTALHVLGLIDDRKALGPWPKLLVMIGAATVITLVAGSRLLEAADPYVGGVWLSILITILWIVVVTNAMNFMDNMDGLAGGVALIAALGFMISAMITGQWFIAALLALVVGGCLGFLVFNFPPASIYMGDAGSLVLGFTLSFLTVQTTYYGDENGLALAGGWYGVFMPLVVLAVPLYDFASVMLIRISQGRSPLVGDTQHFSHRLVERGLSKRGAVTIVWGVTACTAIGGISLGSLDPWQAILVGVQTLLLLGIIAVFEKKTRGAAIGKSP